LCKQIIVSPRRAESPESERLEDDPRLEEGRRLPLDEFVPPECNEGIDSSRNRARSPDEGALDWKLEKLQRRAAVSSLHRHAKPRPA
jgi:hypothetical protein